SWSDCTQQCDGGQQTRSRGIKVHGQNLGRPCDGSLDETAACNKGACSEELVDSNCLWAPGKPGLAARGVAVVASTHVIDRSLRRPSGKESPARKEAPWSCIRATPLTALVSRRFVAGLTGLPGATARSPAEVASRRDFGRRSGYRRTPSSSLRSTSALDCEPPWGCSPLNVDCDIGPWTPWSECLGKRLWWKPRGSCRIAPDCAFSDWTSWSACSATC
ncbi:unnamed protein product, partial [Polarella glacialis]